MKKFLAAILCLSVILPIFATVNFKNESLLAKGKWVKIKVNESGVYELPYATLQKYGFTNPKNVKVYGRGGNVASEDYLLPHMDDLEQSPTMHKNNKIYFYAKGISKDSLLSTSDGIRYFHPQANPYSNMGALFLTEDSSEAPLLIQDTKSEPIDNITNWETNGYNIWYTEEELYNPGMTGKAFLGTDFAKTKEIVYNFNLPAYNSTGNIYLTDKLCLFGSDNMEAYAELNGILMDRTTPNLISGNDQIHYMDYGIMEHGASTQAFPCQDEKFSLKLYINTLGNLKKAWVDYAALVYPTYLGLPATESQLRHFVDLKNGNGIRFSKIQGTPTLIWLVDEQFAPADKPYNVKNCIPTISAEGYSVFAHNNTDRWVELVMFDPNKQQKQPEYIGEVKNQNLHGMPGIPNMLVITNNILKSEAERLAQFHREYDGMDVTVITQDEIFNEFSGGIRDAMAYRLICKMLYDRDPKKFKYLLLFGKGTYDNRMIYTNEASEQLLTYQSDVSNTQTKSYCTDDFFGFLDNSNIPYDHRHLQIAVGRIPVSSNDEARKYVDKLIKYCHDRDQKDCKWKNNILLIAENGDDDIHLEQCETFSEKMISTGNYDLNYNKLYLRCYDPKIVREKFLEYLNSGQHFALFVGHGTPISLTKTQKITNLDKGKETKYTQLPIMYFSSCDVARYDNGGTNIVNSMLANTDGGLIAAIASTRVVYTNLNGMLSDSFAASLAKLPSYYGGDKSLGNIFKDAKNNSKDFSINRLKFCILGDPAIRLTPPEDYINLTAINGTPINGQTKISAVVGDKVTLEGEIKIPNSTVLSDFNGTVTIQLYDNDKFFVSALKTDEYNTRVYTDIFCRGKMLNQTKTEVLNGKFKCTITIPNFSETIDKGLLPVRMIAQSNDGRTYSGASSNIVIDRTTESTQTADTENPAIKTLYIDDFNTFKDGATVGSNFIVYGNIADNNAINSSTEVFTSSMSITLDNGKKTSPIYNYSPKTEQEGSFSFPFYDVDNGRHTIEVTVTDLNGNVQRKAISFFVDSNLNKNLVITNPATATSATIDIDNYDNVKSAEIFVKDSKGNILFNTPVSSFPYEWNLTGNDGLKLAPGDYDVYAKINNSGTKIKKIVILKQ